jgi:hypothetical protein
MKSSIHFWRYPAQLFLQSETFQAKAVEEVKTHILYSVTVFRKSCRLWGIVEKYSMRSQMTIWRMSISRLVYGYKHTLRICNTYRFSTATMVARTRLNVTLYVHCLSCLYLVNTAVRDGNVPWKWSLVGTFICRDLRIYDRLLIWM